MSPSGIRLLGPSDVPAAIRLKEAAGWNQTARDWERLLALEPGGCFCLEHDGALAATATVVTYGRDLAWIGMVLTLPEFRGRGFARQLMACCVAYAERLGIPSIGLDATDMGIGLYREFGFRDATMVERWERPADAGVVDGPGVSPWQCDPEFDLAAFGAGRGALLESLAQEESASIPGLAYAAGRPGSKAAYFGPSVAKSADTAESLLRWFLARHPREPIYQDILEGNREAARLAGQYGFRPVRRLTRMFRGEATQGDDSLVFGIAGFEYG